MIAIVDYGVGNLFSLAASLKKIGAECVISGDDAVINSCGRVILPGVGAFRDAMAKLVSSGLDKSVIRAAESGTPLLGICLGMQLLFNESSEYGLHRGLGLINGCIRPLSEAIPPDLKVPHMGWNSLDIRRDSPILTNTRSGDFVYFVHSYFAADCDDAIVASANYGVDVPAIVQRENVFGCQFHPEKSGDSGLDILRAFCKL